MDVVYVWSDGSGSKTNHPMGWASILEKASKDSNSTSNSTNKDSNSTYPPVQWQVSGHNVRGSSQQAEMMAVITAIESIEHTSHVCIYTDSRYLTDGWHKWIDTWKRNEWINSNGVEVANRHLWERLIKAADKHIIAFEWVRGHTGITNNEKADKLSKMERKKAELKLLGNQPPVNKTILIWKEEED